MALSIEASMRKDLRSSYASSLWTTVIDPRVTLSFFDDEGDALLIHYSDQYTTSASGPSTWHPGANLADLPTDLKLAEYR
jgi:hypothetical protein